MLETLIKLLGLPEGSTEEAVMQAIKDLKTNTTEMAALRAELKLGDDAALTGAVMALKARAEHTKDGAPDLSAYAPIEVVEALKSKVAALENTQVESEVNTLVESAIEDGKLLPVQKEWALSLGKTNLNALKNYVKDTPTIAALKNKQSDGVNLTDQSKGAVSDITKSVFEQIGAKLPIEEGAQ